MNMNKRHQKKGGVVELAMLMGLERAGVGSPGSGGLSIRHCHRGDLRMLPWYSRVLPVVVPFLSDTMELLLWINEMQ